MHLLKIRPSTALDSVSNACSALINKSRAGLSWTCDSILELHEALRALTLYVQRYVPSEDDPEGALVDRAKTAFTKRLAEVVDQLCELLIFADRDQLNVAYTNDDLSDSVDIGTLIYTHRVLYMYVVSTQLDTIFDVKVQDFEAAFTDVQRCRASSEFLGRMWTTPLASMEEPEMRRLAEEILQMVRYYDFWGDMLYQLMWYLEAFCTRHVVFWQDQAEVEHRRIMYWFVGVYRGIVYCRSFAFVPTQLQWSDESFSRFEVFWQTTLRETNFSDIQQKTVLVDVHASFLRPGELALYQYLHPAEEVSAPAIMTSAHSGRSDEVLNFVNELTDLQPRVIYEKYDDEQIREIVLFHIVALTCELRTSINLKAVYVTDPGPSELEQVDIAIVRIINKHVIYVGGEFVEVPGTFLHLLYAFFEYVRVVYNETLLGKSTIPLTSGWQQKGDKRNEGEESEEEGLVVHEFESESDEEPEQQPS